VIADGLNHLLRFGGRDTWIVQPLHNETRACDFSA
jgi:hypothetical protein